MFNELPLGGGSDYQGAAFIVNLALKKKRRKARVQQKGRTKGTARRIAFRVKVRHSKSHLESVSLPIIPVVSGTHYEQGDVGFLTEQIPGVHLSAVTHGSVFTCEFKAHLWSFRTI